MSNDKSNDEHNRRRRCSLAPIPTASIFAKANGPPYPGSVTTVAVQDQLQRMSAMNYCPPGTSPSKTSPYQFGDRRGSASSIGSGTIDENTFEEDDSARSIPNTPFGRRMSLGAQAVRNVRRGSSTSIIAALTSHYGLGLVDLLLYNTEACFHAWHHTRKCEGCSSFNLSDQFRARAESSVTQTQRPYFPGSPNFVRRSSGIAPPQAEMATPQIIVESPAPAQTRQKGPDAFQERILKGDFYID
ncbi:hypothetical protein GcM3_005023 [Golovinomyces cichoracearum]|uniref:Uncharacterized protein n=1 Tax=Golovinomyces cichoracearum TaxID=62708 RepID=A0A420JB38_9PEZI|nr:hypothetical protein GcM3_005023 [Golovinomyces cichoracearum]